MIHTRAIRTHRANQTPLLAEQFAPSNLGNVIDRLLNALSHIKPGGIGGGGYGRSRNQSVGPCHNVKQHYSRVRTAAIGHQK